MKKKKYVISENPYDDYQAKISKKMKGYRFLPKNKVKYQGIQVNSLFVMKPSFIEKLLQKKSQRRLDYYIQYLISLINETDSDGTKMGVVLNDLSRFRDIVEYKYRKFLDDKYIDLLLQKVTLLEHELKTKMMYQQWQTLSKQVSYPEEETKGKAR